MSIGDAAGQASDEKQWAKLAKECYSRRISADKFIALVIALNRRILVAGKANQSPTVSSKSHSTAQGTIICATLLPEDQQTRWSRDQLTTSYIDALISNDDIVRPTDVLSRLLLCRKARLQRAALSSGAMGEPGQLEEHIIHHSADDQILGIVARALSNGTSRIVTLGDAKRLLDELTQWMSSLNAENADWLMSNQSQPGSNTSAEAVAVRESLGLVLLGAFAHQGLTKAFGARQLRSQVEAFDQSLTAFAPLLSETHMQLAQQLDTCQKSQAALRTDAGGHQDDDLRGTDGIDIGELQLNSVMDLAHVNSRAGVFVYLEALLGGSYPIVSDSFMLSFLQSHYKGDYQTAGIDLVIAAFDVLAIGLHTYLQVYPTPAPTSKTFLVRSFMINKLPLLLGMLVSMSFTDAEYIITQALSRLDPSQFHSFDSQVFDGGENGGSGPKTNSTVLSEARQSFLAACALQGLTAEQSIERIIGEATIPVMASTGRKTKATLLTEWNNNGQKMDILVNGVIAMDGNAAAYANAISQIFSNFCNSKDTSSLKVLCMQLCQDPSVLDAMALFTDWRALLRPLCEMLNDWKAEDDQGEYQLVYEEFSSCLLLVLACTYHFDFSPDDLGIGGSGGDNFLCRLLRNGGTSMDVGSMTADQNRQLLGWAKALYVREEIHDELMSQCSPQDFYMLVPTLLHQSILTHARNRLTNDKLLGGLELLRNAFLIPSLIFAIGWLKDHIWQQRADVLVCVQALGRFIAPPSPNSDAHIMHEAVMNIVGQPLLERLQDMRLKNASADSMENDLNQMITNLEERSARSQHQDFARERLASVQEIRHWTSGHSSGPLTPLSNSINMLCFWSASAGIALSTLPAYTARQLDVAVRMTGAQAVLATVLEAVKAQTETGMGAVALDVATAMLATNAARAASTLSSGSDSALEAWSGPTDGTLTLRGAVALELQSAAKTIATDPLRVEALVRLSRRLDAYAITLPPAGQDTAAGEDAAASAAAAAAAAAHADMSGDVVLDSVVLGDGSGLGDLGGGNVGSGDNTGSEHHGVSSGVFDLGGATGGNNALGLDIDSALVAGLGDAGVGVDDVDMTGMGMGGGADGDDGVVGLNLGAATDDDIFAGLGDLEGMDYGM